MNDFSWLSDYSFQLLELPKYFFTVAPMTRRPLNDIFIANRATSPGIYFFIFVFAI